VQADFDDLLLRVLELPEAERRAFLEASEADPEMCAELLDLLAREPELNGFLEDSAANGVDLVIEPTTADQPRSGGQRRPQAMPETVGPFTVKEILGEGGMGVVYLAEQHEPVERLLAVKVIRADLTAPEAAARFIAERQALARLSHPHIAQLYEAGNQQARVRLAL